MAKTLKISSTLALPLDYATKTAAILAQRRKGKTYTASVLAEEMVAAKQPFVALDPTGAWWGLRASADGASAGLPVVILGGQHGDVPLERTAGRLIADLVVDTPGYYVIDFSLFESGEAERQFAVDFAERLYRAKAQPGKNFPLHLFVDEADRFIPQSLTNKSETSPRLLGAFEAIVRRGGLRGLGTTLISQRAAVVNKNVLEMLDVLVALRTIGPNDQKAIKGYVQAHGSEKELADIMGSLASLAIGEAWIWEPGADLFERVQIRQRHTFNSSATPDTAHRPVEPKQLAKVDLDVLKTKMAETIERAKADDPKVLKQRIAELEREKKKPVDIRPASTQTPVEILTDADRELLKDIRANFDAWSKDIGERADTMLQSLAERAKATIDHALKTWTEAVALDRAVFLKRVESARVQRVLDKVERVGVSESSYKITTSHTRPPAQVIPKSQPIRQVNGHSSLKPMHRAMLTALAQHPDGLSKRQVLIHTGYASSGPVSTAFAELVKSGDVEPSGAGLRITMAGLATLGPYDPLPDGDALREWLLTSGKLSTMEASLLRAVSDAYPQPMRKADVLDKTNYASSGPVSTAFAKLVGLGYVRSQGPSLLVASEELFG